MSDYEGDERDADYYKRRGEPAPTAEPPRPPCTQCLGTGEIFDSIVAQHIPCPACSCRRCGSPYASSGGCFRADCQGGRGEAPAPAKPEPPAPSPDLKALLCDVAQVFDGWHSDGTAWTAHDEEVRGRVSAALAALEPAPSPDLDPLEELLQLFEREAEIARLNGWGLAQRALAALRVLKRGHGPGDCLCALCEGDETVAVSTRIKRGNACYASGHEPVRCLCGGALPCGVLAEAARALRGESK